ncbi:MAG: hypothetical protein ABSB99_10175 [Acidimicrobiales bacterium]|jgi:hypothetical protein
MILATSELATGLADQLSEVSGAKVEIDSEERAAPLQAFVDLDQLIFRRDRSR